MLCHVFKLCSDRRVFKLCSDRRVFKLCYALCLSNVLTAVCLSHVLTAVCFRLADVRLQATVATDVASRAGPRSRVSVRL